MKNFMRQLFDRSAYKSKVIYIELIAIIGIATINLSLYLLFRDPINYYSQFLGLFLILLLFALYTLNTRPAFTFATRKYQKALLDEESKDDWIRNQIFKIFPIYKRFNAAVSTHAISARQALVTAIIILKKSNAQNKLQIIYDLKEEMFFWQAALDRIENSIKSYAMVIKRKFVIAFTLVYLYVILWSSLLVQKGVQLGYMTIKGMDLDVTLLDSFYFVLSTISTVGFGDKVPLNNAAKVVVILLVLSFLIIFYAIFNLLENSAKIASNETLKGFKDIYRKSIRMHERVLNLVETNVYSTSKGKKAIDEYLKSFTKTDID